jgi:dTDP-4-dehydrorhamnose reductase
MREMSGSSRPRILVIGPSSLVGSRVIELLSSRYRISLAGKRNPFPLGKGIEGFSPLDLLDPSQISRVIRRSSAEVVINFAAMTDVEACERERRLGTDGISWKVNAAALGHMNKACLRARKRLLHFSTDYVFQGARGPYGEGDAPEADEDALTWYGYTKLQGEKFATASDSDCCIVRIAHAYRSRFQFRTDLARKILTLYKEGRLYPMFVDQWITPTFVDDLAPAIDTLLGHWTGGFFHVASPDVTTPFEFAVFLISTFFGSHANRPISKGSIAEYLAKENRLKIPVNATLKVGKIVKLGVGPRGYKDGILEIHRQLVGANDARLHRWTETKDNFDTHRESTYCRRTWSNLAMTDLRTIHEQSNTSSHV